MHARRAKPGWPFRRVQPPVVSTTSARGFLGALRAVGDGAAARTQLREALASRFGAQRVILTDSGTSATVLALRLAAGPDLTVALPSYICPDLLAAADHAGLRVRLYDLDPRTLSPDLDSLAGALGRGASVVVVAHLFGYAADMTGVAELAKANGATVIEDAAQSAGGRLRGRLLGSYGPLTVLSFGRGKGVSGGGGGALLWTRDAADERVPSSADEDRVLETERGSAGWAALGVTAAQWLLARPRLYGIPASIPFLRLGETRYRSAHSPRSIGACSAGLAADSLGRADDEAGARESTVARLRSAVGDGDLGVASIAGGRPGYLRLPVLLPAAEPSPMLGILRGYPATLDEYRSARRVMHTGEVAGPGAIELRDSLFTVPTHHHVGVADVARIAAWLRCAASLAASSGIGSPRRDL